MFWSFSSTYTNSQSYCPWALAPDPSPDLPSSIRHMSSRSHCWATYCPAPKTGALSPSFSLSCVQPISPGDPTARTLMERLSACWKFLHGGREGPTEIKEESFAAVIAPLYLANHRRIIICEKYIYTKNPFLQPSLPCWLRNEAQGEKSRGKGRGSVLCSEALWNTPGDVWLTYIFRWEMSWGLKLVQKCIDLVLLHFTENINGSEWKQGSFCTRPINS